MTTKSNLRDDEKLTTGEKIFGIFIILIVLFIVFVVVFGLWNVWNDLSNERPHTRQAKQETTRTIDLLSLQLSKEQVETGSFEGRTGGSIIGNVGYVQGSSEGKPVTYIYIRYRAENGDIIDQLLPRDQVRLRDDLAPGEAATVDIKVVKKREATYEDIQENPSLCYDAHPFHGGLDNPSSAPLPADKCGKHPGDKPSEWQFDYEVPSVIHVPKDSVIVTINPNMVPDGAKKG